MEIEAAKKYMNRLNLYFNLIIAIPLLVFGYVYLELEAGRIYAILDPEQIIMSNYLLPFLIIIIGGVGVIIPKSKVKEIKSELDLESKLNAFEKIQLIRYGMYEAGGLISIIGLYFTVEKLYAVLYVGTIILFSLSRPTQRYIIKSLNLVGEEKDLFTKL